jgi:hypothetical protein
MLNLGARKENKVARSEKNPLQKEHFVTDLCSHELTIAFRRPEETNEEIAHQSQW